MKEKAVNSDCSSKVGSFIFSNGIRSFHNNEQGEVTRQEFENSK